MWNFVGQAKRALWAFVELGFLVILALILIRLLLGDGAGSYVGSVTDNVTKFAGAANAGLLGVVIVLAIVYFVLQRTSVANAKQRR
jgi:hypothetical protein